MPPTPAVVRGPLSLLQQLEDAVRTKEPRAFIALFSPHCRRSCAGLQPFPLDRPGPGSMQVMVWTPSLVAGGLVEALGRLFFSYKDLTRLELRPLGLQAGATRGSLVVRIHLEGDDLGGRWRTDQGMARLSLRRDNGRWRVHRFDVLALHSAWRTEPTLESRELPGLGPANGAASGPVDLGWPADLPPSAPWAALDVDSDGANDLVTARGARVLIMAASDGQFLEPRELFRPTGCGQVAVLAPGDRDGDGRMDLFVGCASGASGVWRRGEDGTWRLMPGTGFEGAVAAATWADLDGQGGPDLYVVRRRQPTGAPSRDLMLLGEDKFVPGLSPPAKGAGLAVCAADLDLDGDSELVVLSEQQRPRLWLNQGGARFEEAGARLGLSAAPGATACAVADLDGDGRLDLLLGGRRATRGYLFGRPGAPAPGQGLLPARRRSARLAGLTRGDMFWVSRRGNGEAFTLEPRRLPGLRWTTNWAAPLDLDGDGAVDLLLRELRLPPKLEARWWWQFLGPALAGQKPRPLPGVGRPSARVVLLSNLGRGRFMEAGHPARFPRAAQCALVFGGSDASRGRPHLLLEDARGGVKLLGATDGARGHQLLLRLRANGRNLHAIGALVKLHSEGRRQVRQAGDASGLPGGPPGLVHFGLGAALRAEEVRVRWPGGKWQRFVDLPADRLITLSEGGGASWKDPSDPEQATPDEPPETPAPAPQEDPTPGQDPRLQPLSWTVRQGADKIPLKGLAGPRGTLLLIHGAQQMERVLTLCKEIQMRLDPRRGIRAYRLGARSRVKGCQLPGLQVTPSTTKALASRKALLPLLMLLDGNGKVLKEVGAGLGLDHMASELD